MLDHASTMLWAYPQSSNLARRITKKDLFEQMRIAKSLRDLFTQQIASVIWANNLSVKTLNIRGCESVNEVQVFKLELKDSNISHEILRSLDQAIPSQLIFELCRQDSCSMVACLKVHGKDGKQDVCSPYYQSPWFNAQRRCAIPNAIDMAQLYMALMQPLLPIKLRAGEHLLQLIERLQGREMLNKELTKLQKSLNGTKQFNRKVELNAQLRQLKQKLQQLD